MKTILLSAGHHPRQTGASWNGIKEHDIAMIWVNAIFTELMLMGVDVVKITPSRLPHKVERVNAMAALRDCIAVELHFNSAGDAYVQGNETLYYPGSIAGELLATAYNTAFMDLAKQWVIKDRGVKAGWYKMDRPGVVDFYGDKDGDEMPDYWLRKTNCPALILEPCFMCQLDDIGVSNWMNVAHSIAHTLATLVD